MLPCPPGLGRPTCDAIFSAIWCSGRREGTVRLADGREVPYWMSATVGDLHVALNGPHLYPDPWPPESVWTFELDGTVYTALVFDMMCWVPETHLHVRADAYDFSWSVHTPPRPWWRPRSSRLAGASSCSAAAAEQRARS